VSKANFAQGSLQQQARCASAGDRKLDQFSKFVSGAFSFSSRDRCCADFLSCRLIANTGITELPDELLRNLVNLKIL
jgi:hypothetical protein